MVPRPVILLAPDAFKGTFTAPGVCARLTAILGKDFDCVSHPLADGGEGTLTAIATVQAGVWRQVSVQGPLPEQTVTASYLWLPHSQTAVIEMATASGLTLIPAAQRDPERTTSFGTGQLLRHGADQGARQIQLAIGGSATNDAGLGALMALGWQFLTAGGESVGWGGSALARVMNIVPPPHGFSVPMTVWCDVRNPLYGTQGAAWVYAPQKGADPAMVSRLDQGLRHFAQQVKQQFGQDLQFPGAGAAGGMGAGIVWGLGATLQSGFSAIANLTQLAEAIHAADMVITGEGCFDTQSTQGKVVGGVMTLAQAANKPVVVLAGKTLLDSYPGITQIFATIPPHTPVPTTSPELEAQFDHCAGQLKQFLHQYFAPWRSPT